MWHILNIFCITAFKGERGLYWRLDEGVVKPSFLYRPQGTAHYTVFLNVSVWLPIVHLYKVSPEEAANDIIASFFEVGRPDVVQPTPEAQGGWKPSLNIESMLWRATFPVLQHFFLLTHVYAENICSLLGGRCCTPIWCSPNQLSSG